MRRNRPSRAVAEPWRVNSSRDSGSSVCLGLPSPAASHPAPVCELGLPVRLASNAQNQRKRIP
jgi:hypothetical protein